MKVIEVICSCLKLKLSGGKLTEDSPASESGRSKNLLVSKDPLFVVFVMEQLLTTTIIKVRSFSFHVDESLGFSSKFASKRCKTSEGGIILLLTGILNDWSKNEWR